MEKEIQGQTVIRGAMILALAVFISRLIGLIYKIPITNILKDEGMAIYASAYSVYALLLTFSSIGMPGAISKLVSERIATGRHRDAHRVFKVALLYTVLIGILTSFLLWFGAEYISLGMKGDTTLIKPLRALSPTLVIVSAIAIIRGYFQGLGSMVPSASSQVIEQIFNAVCSVTFAYLLIPHGMIEAATGSTLGPGVGALASLIFLTSIYVIRYKKIHKHIKDEVVQSNEMKESTTRILKQVVTLVVPILLTSSIFSITTTIDQKMLYTMLPPAIAHLEEHNALEDLPISDVQTYIDEGTDTKILTDKLVGQYMSKYTTLIALPVSLILQLTTAAMPAIAGAMMLKNYEDLTKKIYMVMKTGIMLAIPATMGLAVFGREVVPILFSGAPDGGDLIMYGAIGILPMSIAQLTGGILQGMGKQRIPVRNALIACVLKFILNLIFLSDPYLHIYSVVSSTTLCYCIYAFLNIRALNKEITLTMDWKHVVVKPAIAALIMGVVSFVWFRILESFITLPILSIGISILLAIGIYGIVLIRIGGVSEDELLSLPGGSRLGRLIK